MEQVDTLPYLGSLIIHWAWRVYNIIPYQLKQRTGDWGITAGNVQIPRNRFIDHSTAFLGKSAVRLLNTSRSSCWKSNAIPVLLYGLEVCSLTKAQIKSMDYAISSCYRKIFNVKSNENVRLCMDMFNCDDVDTLLAKRRQKFLSGFVHLDIMQDSDVI